MDNTSLTEKIKMAKTFLESVQLLEGTLNQIFAKSQEEAESKVEDIKVQKKNDSAFPICNRF